MTNGEPDGRETELIPVDRLSLDPENPRLPEGGGTEDQDQLVEFVAEEYDALKIAESLARYGYFPSEPLIAIEEDDGYVVVEGNRRLAALKLLRSEELRDRLELQEAERWDRVAEVATDQDLEVVPVDVRPSRVDVAPVLGFRHISGIEPWDPWAKARFIAGMVEVHGRSFEEAASLVGERETDVRSHYRNYRIVQQAEEDFELDTSLVKSSFGIFTRAMQSRDLRAHIGAPAPRDTEPRGNPIPAGQRGQLEELLGWLFGTPEDLTRRVISESRDISDLATVVDSESGLRELRETGDLEEAFQTAGGVLDRLLSRLTNARNNLLRAREDLAAYADNDEVQDLIRDCADALNELREG